MQKPARRRRLATLAAASSLAVWLAWASAPALSASTEATEATTGAKPTIVLVHGAFAESSSWEAVVARLLAKGYPVVAAANPLRGVHSDATYLASLVDSIPGPIVLVGHSYGGSVITNAATGRPNVKALVYVAAFAPDAGESLAILSAKYPGSTLGAALLPPVPLSDGNYDLYVKPSEYRESFAADVPPRSAALLAATQRPLTAAAQVEPSGTPAWKFIPSWFIYGTRDKAIPPALQPFMAERAHSRHTVAVEGASHAVMASHPEPVVKLIMEAAGAGV
ncbi:alpha/beta hydrolase [Piscinibacter sp. XHJ-5]|uniref:alpha/beta fold hydrolase n=1 Tax=Piscinibacter sp. XHJ-5 TaxID=3037797 RepID=UPI002452BCE0|nr:alpha/beta hydrolase [Piscinibacter sp. XHJ-5]